MFSRVLLLVVPGGMTTARCFRCLVEFSS